MDVVAGRVSALEVFSASWHRVAELKPRLRGHAELTRHHYRGKLWYVLQDQSSRRVHRFSETAYQVIGQMDGYRSLQEIWDGACARLGDDAPTQDETIRILAQLHATDLLQCEIPPDADELLRRQERLRSIKMLQVILSPLSVKFPLLDPERFLRATLPFYRPFFSWFGALLWLAVVGGAVVLAGLHWEELTRDITDRALAPENLAVMWFTFPVLKLFHEFGHACAVKRWGGEVHEMGIMLLVLMPIPYVDASASSAFRSKHQRIVVGAAGMLVESFIAALTLFLWVSMEPGIARSVAYNVLLIAGASTLLFNINPLLRFDGYYMFSDLVEIPNLRVRANRYVTSLAERYLLGMREVQPGHEGAGEKRWFVFFAIASFIYRLFITFAIVFVIAGKYFIFGVLLAIWAAAGAIVLPLVKALHFLLLSPRLRRTRSRAMVGTAAGLALLAAVVFLMPLPMWTRAEGVIWVPEQAIVRPGAEGFVARLVAAPNAMVNKGDTIMELEEPLLAAHIRILQARLEEFEAQYDAQRVNERVRAELTRESMNAARAELDRATERARSLTVTAPVSGRLVLARPDDLQSKFVRQGQEIAYVVEPGSLTARVMVPQQDIDLVRNRTTGIEVLLSEQVDAPQRGSVRREVPAATAALPNMALAVEGGGKVALDPRERNKAQALQKYFQFEVELPARQQVHIGSRVYVRFDHGYEPLAAQCYRRLRQVFLKQLNV